MTIGTVLSDAAQRTATRPVTPLLAGADAEVALQLVGAWDPDDRHDQGGQEFQRAGCLEIASDRAMGQRQEQGSDHGGGDGGAQP